MTLSITERLRRIAEDEDAVFDGFGFLQEWRRYPIVNQASRWWLMNGSSVVTFDGDDMPSARHIEEHGGYPSESIRGHYRCDGLSAFVLDTRCDGNVNFTVLSDAKRITDRELLRIYAECWGSGA